MGEHKYRCKSQGCTKTFNRRDYLERHAANHLQVKPYVCHQCERQFSRRDLYENHLTTRFHSRRTREKSTPSAKMTLPKKESDHPQTQQSPRPAQISEELQPLPMGPDEVYFNGHPPMEFDLNATPSNSELQHGLIGEQMPSDFDPGSFYGVIPGLDSERWDYYRPFKPLPALNDYGERSSDSLKRRASPLGSNISVSEGGDSVASSEGSGGANSNDTVESRSTNATSFASANSNDNMREESRYQQKQQEQQDHQQQSKEQKLQQSIDSQVATQSSVPAAAYKMWLIDRFQNDESPQIRNMREPEGPNRDYDKQFEWFFDDAPNSSSSNQYDFCSMAKHSSQMYKERFLEYEALNWPKKEPRKSLPKTDDDHAQLVTQIIASGSAEIIKSGRDVDLYLQVAWTKANMVSCIVHRPTFDPNTSHPALLAVLVALGMALSGNLRAKDIAKMAGPNISLFVYESLQQPDGPMSARFSPAYIGHFQAFCLLYKYEPVIIGPDLYSSSLISASSCRRCADKFISSLIASVPHLEHVKGSQPWSLESARKPVWATITEDSYILHKNVDRGAQWREWVAYEMCKRTVHFTVYYDSVISKWDSTHSITPISLFSLDIHAPAPESVWNARDVDEFYHTVGPTNVLTNVPFFGLIKSILAPPVSKGSQDGLKGAESTQNQESVSLFTFRMLAHGLMNITSRVTGVFGQGEQLMKAVLGRLQPEDEEALQVKPYFDQQVQSRLYHGLDFWFQQFENSFGQITDKLYNISDALGLRITPEIANDFKSVSDEQDRGSIPQYALYLVLYQYTSFIVVHEDLPVILQAATNLAKWLKHDKQFDQARLLECLYMPLYVQWIQSDEAKAMVSTSSLILVWVDAASGQVDTKCWNQVFLSAMIYTSVIVVLLHDLVSHYNASKGSSTNYSAGHVNTQNYDFIAQASQHLKYVHDHPDGNHHRPSSKSPVLSVLLMGACILYNRPHTKDLYEHLERLICALDPSLTPDRVRLVLEGAPEMFKNRYTQSLVS